MSVQPRRIASAAQLMLHRRHNFTRTRVRTRSIKHFTLVSFLSFSFGLAAAQGASSKEPPKCLVQGQVVHEPGGQPLKKVTVKLNPEDKENGTTYKAMSDLEGRFKFEKVEAGDYTLTIDRNGFLETGKQKGVHKLNLRPGNEVKDVVLRMQPSAVINGKILDNDGDPLPGVSITVRKPGTSSPQRGIVSTGYTDDLGEYRIGNLRPGRYLIEANLIDYSFEPEATVKMADETRETAPYTTYYPGGTDKSQAATIELRAGDEVAINLTLTYGPAYRVRGTLVGMPDLAGADANMVLRPKDQGPGVPVNSPRPSSAMARSKFRSCCQASIEPSYISWTGPISTSTRQHRSSWSGTLTWTICVSPPSLTPTCTDNSERNMVRSSTGPSSPLPLIPGKRSLSTI